MPTLTLTEEEAQQLVQRVINSDPLLAKILKQLAEQREKANDGAKPDDPRGSNER